VAAAALVLGVVLSSSSLAAQKSDEAATAALPRVSFQFEHPMAAVPRFTLTVNDDGKASYTAEQPLRPVDTRRGTRNGGTRENEATPEMQHIEKTILLTPATTAKIFELTRSLDHFQITCESTAKNVADMGKKTLRYTGPEGDGECVYNYSGDTRVVALTAMLQGIGTTLDFGRRLDFEHRFDRLALDQETQDLVASAEEGQAIELNVIARTLRSIAQDTEVLERVRGRAASLLQRFAPAE
jgi:hypothetical protein